jgi:ribosomal protein S18 acetylase RimI-like enzyme
MHAANPQRFSVNAAIAAQSGPKGRGFIIGIYFLEIDGKSWGMIKIPFRNGSIWNIWRSREKNSFLELDLSRSGKEASVNNSAITYRLMKADDFDAVVGIDEKVRKAARPEYYALKFDMLFNAKDALPASIVAVAAEGTVVGFVMGRLYMGEYGIFQEEATLDTIGVDPDCQQQGIGGRLIDEFMDHLKELGVRKVNTLVDREDKILLSFFSANRFAPSNTVNLERRVPS